MTATPKQSDLVDLIGYLAVGLATYVVWKSHGFEPAGSTVHIGLLFLILLTTASNLVFRTAGPALRNWYINRVERSMLLRMVEPEEPQLRETMRTIVGAWHAAVNSIEDAKTRALMAAFLARYAREESKALRGETRPDRHFVVTRFLTYSAAVTALVAEAQDQYRESTIVCFTSLPMRLTRWFNYRAKAGRADLENLRVDKYWEEYKQILRTLADTPRISLSRRVVAATREHEQLADIAFATDESMRAEFDYTILLRNSNDERDWTNLTPFSREEVADVVTALEKQDAAQARTIAAEIDNLHGDKDHVYIILPRRPDDLPRMKKYEWFSLWQAFLLSAHEHPDDCRYVVHGDADVTTWFDCNERDQMPEDFFAIGIRDRNAVTEEPKWMFCVAGNVGRDLERVTLEVLIAGTKSQADRYERFMKYIHHLWQARHAL